MRRAMWGRSDAYFTSTYEAHYNVLPAVELYDKAFIMRHSALRAGIRSLLPR